MKRLPKRLLLAIALAWPGAEAAWAQQDPGADGTWTLQEAVEYAKANNLQVRQAYIDQQTAEVNLRQSRFARLPSLNGNASHSYNYGTSIDPLTNEFKNEQIRSNNFSASATVPLFQGLQLTKQIKQGELTAEANANDVLAIQNDITLQILTSYLNILFANELIKTAELQRSNTQQQLDRTRILFDAGSVAETNVLELESQLASDELNVINAQNQAEISRLNLIQLLDLDNPEAFEVDIPELPNPDVQLAAINTEQVFDVAVQTLPEIKAADLRVQSAQAGVGVARGAYYPRLFFNASMFTGYSSSRALFGNEVVAGEFIAQEIGFNNPNGTDPVTIFVPRTVPTITETPFWDQIDDNYGKSISFSLSIPVFNGLQTRSAVERAKLNQQSAKLNADLQRNQLRQNIEQAAADARASLRSFIASRRQVESLERSYRNAELRLNAGIINSTDFNVISNDFRRAQSDLLQAKYDYIFKLKVLDFYQGKDISF